MKLHEEGGAKNGLTQQTNLTEKGQIVNGRTFPAGATNQHDILTGSTIDGMLKTGMTCSDWTAATGSSYVGHSDRMGTQADPVTMASWNSSHDGLCNDTSQRGGAGRFYCFATN